MPATKAPKPIPASRAMYMVAIARPICAAEPKSFVHAAKVGVLNPQEIPNIIAELITVNVFNSITIRNMAPIKNKPEINKTGTRPWRSELLEKKIRTKMEETV